jgi:hypothetical protein
MAMKWWRAKYRTDDGKLHLWVVEAENEVEATMMCEMEIGATPETLEVIDESAFASPLLTKFPQPA